MASAENRSERPARLTPYQSASFRSRKSAVAVAQVIMDQITREGLAPGAKLSSEATMIDELAVSRGTLRESLRFLELNGIVTIKPGPGGGPVVCHPGGHDLASTLGLFLQALGTRFGAIAEVRHELEPTLAALAAERISDDELAALRATITEMENKVQDLESFLEINRAFHDIIAEASGNPLFALLISSLHHVTDGTLLGVSYKPRQRKAVVAAHEAIFERLAAHDPDGARAMMTRHMGEYQTYLDRNYPDVADTIIRWQDVAP